MIIKLELIKEVIYFLRSSKKLEKYNKECFIYTKDENTYSREKK